MSSLVKIISNLDNKSKKEIILTIPFIVIITILEFLSVAIIIPILNIFTDPNFIYNYQFINSFIEKFSLLENNFFTNNLFLILINAAFFLFLILIIFKNIIYLLFIRYKSNLLERIHANFQQKFISNFFKTSYQDNASKNSSSFITTENNIGHLVSSIENLLVVVSELLIIFSIFLLILYKNLIFGLSIIILIILFSFTLIKSYKNIINTLGYTRNISNDKKTSFLLTIFSGFREIKLFKKEKYFNNLYKHYSLLSLDSTKKINNYNALPKSLLEIFIIFLASIFVFYLSFLEKKPDIILSSIGFYLFTAIRLVPSINKILINFQSLKYNKHFINDFYKKQISDKFFLFKNYKYINFKRFIKFKKVFFSYEEKNSIFKNFNFLIKKGEKVGIIGSSGIGKTTFINMLIGLLKPTNGKISIDDKNYSNFILNKCYLVTSNNFFINDTILKNICFGNINKKNLLRVKEIIKIVELENFVKNLKSGLNTVLSDKGSKISSGQIQRVNIARALYSNPEILILDEATNALDKKTEAVILNNIFKLYRNLTIIIISHKINNLKYCGKIYKIHKNFLMKYNKKKII